MNVSLLCYAHTINYEGFTLSNTIDLATKQNIIKEVHAGTPRAEIATKFGVSERSIRRFMQQYREGVITLEDTTPDPIDLGGWYSSAPSHKVKNKKDKKKKDKKPKDLGYKYITGKMAINIFAPDGHNYTINSKSAKFDVVKKLVEQGKLKEACEIIDTAKTVMKYANGMVTIEDGVVRYGSKDITSSIGNRIISCMEEGSEFTNLVLFLKKLMNNASPNSIEMLWDFIEHNDIKLDSNGNIVAWKKVTSTSGGLRDSYHKTIPNDLGTVVSMVRSQVVDDPTVTCTYGLHVGAWGYVSSFSGDTILRVVINPEDVVSVPEDYNGMKMRVSKYFVEAIVDSKQNVIKLADSVVRQVRADKSGKWEDITNQY